MCGAPALARGALPAAAPCDAAAYRGYAPAAGQGAPVLDMAWHRRVRPVRTDQGCVRYVLGAAPRLGQFDRIHTLPLGGGVTGFAAYRDGQSWLYSALGEDLLGQPLRGEIRAEPPPAGPRDSGDPRDPRAPDAATLALVQADGATRYVRLQRGRVQAQSPHAYAPWPAPGASPALPALARRHAPAPPLRQVLAAQAGQAAAGAGQGARGAATNTAADAAMNAATNMPQNMAMGLLDMRSLREVVPARYAAAGALPGRGGAPWLLFGQQAGAQGGALHWFLPDGAALPAPMPATRAFSLVHAPGGGVAYLALLAADGAACHYLNPQRQPMLPLAVPLAPQAAPAAAEDASACPPLDARQPLRFTGADGRVHRYRFTPADGLQPLGAPLPGRLLAAHGGRLVLQLPLPPAPPSVPLPTPSAAPGLPASAPVAAPAASAPTAATSDAPAAAPLPRYQVYLDNGQPLGGAQGFEGFEDLGCGAWRLQRDGLWHGLDAQGRLTPPPTAPAC